jgi:hypothetical protein
MNILEHLGITFLVLSIMAILGLLIYFIHDVLKYPKEHLLGLWYSLKYMTYEIRGLFYQNPNTKNNTNPQSESRPQYITNYNLILAQFNQAINTKSKANNSNNKIHYSLPRFHFNSLLNQLPNFDKHHNKDNYNSYPFPINTHPDKSITNDKEESTKTELNQKNDLLGAVDYIRNHGIRSKIGLLGFSMRAAISLITTAESPDISAVVANSAYVDVISLIKWKLSRWKFLCAFLVPLFLLVTKILYKIDFSRVKPLESMKK